MSKLLSAYLSALFSYLILDGLWLYSMSTRLYKPYLSHLMAQNFNALAAGILYLIYVFGLCYLVILPKINNAPLIQIFIAGAIFGLSAYAAYDLTNQASLKDWPLIITIIDIAWGALLSGAVSVISVFFTRLIVP